ncbi:outer membrane beta-barrel protein [Lysobacter sp. SG-8]|uniref:Outer membrane beta-barrel protein n=1 Tax=Marilutibacter penaei TaxID=2759900 RepID=A0A7W3U2H8_9GAMM|nr:outer membrane beta-barrel protein [Lysobacter penaei]MBB1087415.1 outer membrane beta-barrel protein [Lysobacter penaei]
MQTRPRMQAPRHTLLSLAIVGAALLPGRVGAIDLDYELSVGVTHNSNIILSEYDEISETTLAPGIDFSFVHEGRSVDATARGNVRYLHYTSGTFDDEVRSGFSGHLRWRALPERLDFMVDDYLSQQPVNILSPLTPSNTQRVNVLVGGPTLYLRFGDRTRGQLDLRYTRNEAEETADFDGHRLNGAFRVLHDLTPTSRASFNVEANQVEFDDTTVSSDYDRWDVYGNYQRNLNDFDASLDLGYSRLDVVDGAGHDAPLARLALDWRLSAETSLSASLDYQFSDTARSLVATPIGPDLPVGTDIDVSGTIVSSDPYRQKRAEIGFQHATPRYAFDATVFHEQAEYIEADDFDNRFSGAYVGYTHRFNALTDLNLTADYQRREYETLDRLDRDLTLGIGIERRFTRHLTGRFNLLRRTRDSSVQGFSYDDNAALVSIAYRR